MTHFNTQQDACLAPEPETENATGGNRTAAKKYDSQFSPIDRRVSGHIGLFKGSEKLFTTVIPEATHWSIAWSDLMMTMFVLFLSMFVYQAAHQDFLISDQHGIIGGETTEALEVENDSSAVLPFSPIKPGKPFVNQEEIKKVVSVPINDVDEDSFFMVESPEESLDKLRQDLEKELATIPPQVTDKPLSQAKTENETIADQEKAIVVEKQVPPKTTDSDRDIIEPRPLTTDQQNKPSSSQDIKQIFDSGTNKLAQENLENFASLQLIPDKTVRIVLTSDLLFDLGSATLSKSAMSSLEKIAQVLKDTPYMINVVGHTDNTPMHSERFATNWELSVARASTVARFLINKMSMNPNQFIVSGYSSYRPLKPNNNTQNRAKNRRVEIIVSKRLPAPMPANDLTTREN